MKNNFLLRNASPEDVKRMQERRLYIINELVKELHKGEIYPNRFGKMVQLMTPKCALLSLEGIGMTLVQNAPEVVRLSYPFFNATDHERITQIMYTCAAELMYSKYDLLLWDPRIWEGATSGSESFLGKLCESDDLPRVDPKSQVWWHAISRSMPENPFTEETGWWTPEWELHGIYIYASERKNVGPDGTHNSTGFCSFWFNDSVDPLDQSIRICLEPGIQNGCALGAHDAVIAAAHRFISLPFVATKTETPLNRQDRKYYKRVNLKVPEVTTIVLRKLEYSREPASSGETDGSGREFDCHFLVGGSTGFWRRPPCTSKSTARVYVRPFIKGNLLRPFKPPNRVVHIARR